MLAALSPFLAQSVVLSLTLMMQTTAPVTVDDYRRDYEPPKNSNELQYENRLQQALSARTGQMEGSWIVTATDGRKLIRLELRGGDKAIEGAWRAADGGFGLNRSGFIADATLIGRDLELNYFIGNARSPVVLHLRKDSDGLWRGTQMNPAGEKVTVVVTRDAGG